MLQVPTPNPLHVLLEMRTMQQHRNPKDKLVPKLLLPQPPPKLLPTLSFPIWDTLAFLLDPSLSLRPLLVSCLLGSELDHSVSTVHTQVCVHSTTIQSTEYFVYVSCCGLLFFPLHLLAAGAALQSLTSEQLHQLEGMERANVEARIAVLRDVQKLLDSAVLRLNQYSTVMSVIRCVYDVTL